MMVQHTQINKHNTAYKQILDKNHITISVDSEKAFEKSSIPHGKIPKETKTTKIIS
jgi:hypothetical protein